MVIWAAFLLLMGLQMTGLFSQAKSIIKHLPRWLWAAVGGGIVLIVVLIVVLLVVLPSGGNRYITLDASMPAWIHPDGLAVTLTDPASSVRVQVDSVPREAFLADQAGREWVTARAALPSYLMPLSPIYIIQTRGEGQITAEMAVPNNAEPLTLVDLYRWDKQQGQWVFVPSYLDAGRQVIIFTPVDSRFSVMAVRHEPQTPAVGVIISPGGPDLGPNYGLAMPEGVSIGPDGILTGTPVAATASTVLPVVANRQGGLTAYSDATTQAQMVEQLVSLAASYDGVVLDFDAGPGYSDFVAVLAERLHADGKQLGVVLRDLSSYGDDPHLLGQYADMIWLAPADDPTIYLPDGLVQQALSGLVGMVDRSKVGLWVSGLSVDVVEGTATPISFDQAMALFGTVEPVAGYLDPAVPMAPGSLLPLRLTGQIESTGVDSVLGMSYLTYHDETGRLHTVYLGSAQGLSNKLGWANEYGLGAVAVYGLAHPDAPINLADGITAFLSRQSLGEPQGLEIVWRVQSSSGASLSEQTGDLSLIQYLWQAATEPGQYMIAAAVREQARESQRGQVIVEVAGQSAPADVPTPTATLTPTPNVTPGLTSTPRPTNVPTGGLIAPGAFELGGQTQSLSHPELMRYAGMTWVKFQHKWGEGDSPSSVAGLIQQAHSLGFKVLLSIPGPDHPSSINYTAYVNFLAGVAALGPDAIEVWNEMNINREWPTGQINGANYVTNMLAPAYQAIKAANPNVMVISGAPAPTGYWGACAPEGCDDWLYIAQMRDAGAASYLDCVGIHYNEGIIPPSQTSGDPRSEHYTRYFFGMLNLYYSTLGKPLCFTELGYLSPEGYGTLPGGFSWAQNTTVAQQAAWLAEAAVLASQSGKVRLMIIFNVDFTVWGDDPQAGYAIVRPGGSCPACDALHAVLP
jgi:hypothetical protein